MVVVVVVDELCSLIEFSLLFKVLQRAALGQNASNSSLSVVIVKSITVIKKSHSAGSGGRMLQSATINLIILFKNRKIYLNILLITDFTVIPRRKISAITSISYDFIDSSVFTIS